jgi:hypothetical protein
MDSSLTACPHMLQTHFKQLHEPEFGKRLQKAAKKARKGEQFLKRVEKYNAAKQAMQIPLNIRPEMGTDIEWHLQKCKYQCEKVPTRSQAADKNLIRSALSCLSGIEAANDGRHHVMCLISDDGGFAPTMQQWKSLGMSTLAICETRYHDQYPCADVTLSWHGVQHALYEEVTA